jgi:hypothetical protein
MDIKLNNIYLTIVDFNIFGNNKRSSLHNNQSNNITLKNDNIINMIEKGTSTTQSLNASLISLLQLFQTLLGSFSIFEKSSILQRNFQTQMKKMHHTP